MSRKENTISARVTERVRRMVAVAARNRGESISRFVGEAAEREARQFLADRLTSRCGKDGGRAGPGSSHD